MKCVMNIYYMNKWKRFNCKLWKAIWDGYWRRVDFSQVAGNSRLFQTGDTTWKGAQRPEIVCELGMGWLQKSEKHIDNGLKSKINKNSYNFWTSTMYQA